MAYEIKPGQGTVWKSDPGKPSVYSGKGKDTSGADVWIDLYVVTDKQTGEPRLDKNGNAFFNVRLKQRDGADTSLFMSYTNARVAPDFVTCCFCIETE